LEFALQERELIHWGDVVGKVGCVKLVG
jgi:hypothetical protein